MKRVYNPIPKDLLNAKTRALIDTKFTPDMVSFIETLSIVPEPFPCANDAVFWVQDMPVMPTGWEKTNCWIEGNLDEATTNTILVWRYGTDGFVNKNTTLTLVDQTPVPHVTNLFSHCPTAVSSKEELRAMMPTAPFRFARVKALGPEGKENCWVAMTEDKAVVSWLELSRGDRFLNTWHKSYVAENGWEQTTQEFTTVIPHATLVRGLKDLDVNNPPALGVLANHEARLVSMTEWVGLKKGDVKIKLAKFYA